MQAYFSLPGSGSSLVVWDILPGFFKIIGLRTDFHSDLTLIPNLNTIILHGLA